MKQYLKGNLHLHTNVSDGNASPQEVANIYKSLGYDFLVFTDHEINYNPYDKFSEPMDNLISIPGIENGLMSENYFKNMAYIHLNGIDFEGDIKKQDFTDIPDCINKYFKEYYSLGAIPQVNHPNWGGTRLGFSYNYAELLKVEVPFLLEIANYSFANYSEGNAAFESCEYMWDVLLSNGKTVYGTMTDDTHLYHGQEWLDKKLYDYVPPAFKLQVDEMFKEFLPGNGFVMVKADFNKKSIREGLISGNFYASNGLFVDFYEYDDKSIKVRLNNQNGENNRIIFKGKMGLPLKIIDGNEAVYEFQNIMEEEYVRVKVINGDSKTAMFQPIFRDGRKLRLEI